MLYLLLRYKNLNMKLFILVLVSLLVITKAYSQEKAVEDSLLGNLITQTQNHWNIEIREGELIIESKDSMWIDFYNIAGAPFNDPEYLKYTAEYLMKNGEKTKARIRFGLEPKWSQEKTKQAGVENLKIYNEIDSLIYKYELSHLERSFRWHEELFWSTTKEEEARIVSYKAEKKRLMNTIIKIPAYQSENHSLFLIERNWRLGEVNSAHLLPMIFPDTELKEIDILEALIEEVLKTSTNKK
jgi:hypothetical protein